MRDHVGRAFIGTGIEDECPCPKAPCGLVIEEQAEPRCAEHGAERTMRQGHSAEQCPGARTEDAMIRDWFRTTAALVSELEEAREECAELAAERDHLAEKLAQAERDRDGVWQAFALEETRPLPVLTPDVRAEIARERVRADALEARLDLLQRANMRLDVPA